MTQAIKAPVAFTHTTAITSSEAVAANPRRTYLLIQNNDSKVVYLAFGQAAVMDYGVRLNANGGSYEMSRALGNLTDAAVNTISDDTEKVCGVEGSL